MSSLSKMILEKMKSDGINTSKKKTQQMTHYIKEKAREYLKGKDGYVDPNIVYGWARHFYEESDTVINNELKSMGVVNTSSVEKTNELVKQYKADKAEEKKKDDNQLSLEL